MNANKEIIESITQMFINKIKQKELLIRLRKVSNNLHSSNRDDIDNEFISLGESRQLICLTKERLESLIKNRNHIVTTIGVYADGSYKTNGVLLQHLITHIEYNIERRPGRSLIIDGVLVYKGYDTNADLNELCNLSLTDLKQVKDTQPYV